MYFFLEGNFKCQHGQGGSGDSIRVTPSITKQACVDDCLYHTGCKSFDFTTTKSNFEDSCRLYGSTVPRLGGSTNREFCESILEVKRCGMYSNGSNQFFGYRFKNCQVFKTAF